MELLHWLCPDWHFGQLKKKHYVMLRLSFKEMHLITLGFALNITSSVWKKLKYYSFVSCFMLKLCSAKNVLNLKWSKLSRLFWYFDCSRQQNQNNRKQTACRRRWDGWTSILKVYFVLRDISIKYLRRQWSFRTAILEQNSLEVWLWGSVFVFTPFVLQYKMPYLIVTRQSLVTKYP